MIMSSTPSESLYAELTPVSLAESSSSSSSTLDGPCRNNFKITKVHEFHRFIDELEYGAEQGSSIDSEDPEIKLIAEENGVQVEPEEEEENEDLNVKYPYERKDRYADLQDRIEKRLREEEEDDDMKQMRDRVQEVKLQLKQTVRRQKMEEKEASQEGKIRFIQGSIFTCVICSKAFSNSDELQLHTSKAHDISGNNHKCKQCGKAYKHKKNLELHMALHLKEFRCGSCPLVFQSASTLQNHIARHHVVQEEDGDKVDLKKKCSMCRKSFPESNIKQHEWYCKNRDRILKQRAEKTAAKKALSVPPSPAMSVVSTASFASYQPGGSSPIVSPVVSYRDKSCRVCGENFASRQSMLRHVGRKHPEAKDDPNVTAVRYVSTESPTHQYACVDCGKRLTTRAALTVHRSRAHGAGNTAHHECQHCKKTFVVPSELRKHIQRVHEKPFNKPSVDQLPDIDDIF